MKIVKFLYACWCFFWFLFFMLLLYPLFAFTIFIRKYQENVKYLFKFWARATITMSFLTIKETHAFEPDPHQAYVYCANHTSFLDIALIHATVKSPVIFLGKESLARIPLFGFIFRHLNIAVNRESKISSYQAFEKVKQILETGKSVVIFAEGGINHRRVPGLLPFKDGAFRSAIEKQVPIVPVVMPFNWIVLPPYQPFVTYHPLHICYLPPVPTQGLTINDVDALKKRVYQEMLFALQKYFPQLLNESIH